MSALRFTLALSVVCASFVCNSEGKSYTRPICDFHDTTSCLSFDADPDPEPFTVLDKLGRKAIAPNQGSVPTPPPIPGQDDPLLDIVAKGVDIPPEDKGTLLQNLILLVALHLISTISRNFSSSYT